SGGLTEVAGYWKPSVRNGQKRETFMPGSRRRGSGGWKAGHTEALFPRALFCCGMSDCLFLSVLLQERVRIFPTGCSGQDANSRDHSNPCTWQPVIWGQGISSGRYGTCCIRQERSTRRG